MAVFLGLLLALGNMAPVFAAGSVFVSGLTQPAGIVATPYKLLFTVPYSIGNPRLIMSVDSLGAVTLFATLPNRPISELPAEEYIAISPGLGGFPASFVYVVQGTNIVQVTPDGLTVSVFATIPSLPCSHSGIAFDHVGTFGFDMIISAGGGGGCGGPTGEVWRVNSAGVATLVATVTGTPTPILEGPEVAPLGFAPYGGQIVLASENFGGGTVFAVSAAGVVSTVASVADAEDVRFIPPNPCNFGSSGGSYFQTRYSDTPGASSIWKFPQTDLVGLGGSALVGGEYSGALTLLTSNGVSITSSTFATGLPDIQEGSTIVDCTVPGPPSPVGGTVRGVDDVALLSPWLAVLGVVGCMATVGVFVRTRRRQSQQAEVSCAIQLMRRTLSRTWTSYRAPTRSALAMEQRTRRMR